MLSTITILLKNPQPQCLRILPSAMFVYPHTNRTLHGSPIFPELLRQSLLLPIMVSFKLVFATPPIFGVQNMNGISNQYLKFLFVYVKLQLEIF